MKFVFAVAFAATISLAAAAAAETITPTTSSAPAASPAADQDDAPAKPKPQSDPNQVVCKAEQVTGSRLGGHRICHTRAEWDQKTQEDRNVINNMQSQVMKGPGE